MSRTVELVIADLQRIGKLKAPRKRGRKNWNFDCPFHSPDQRQDTPSFGIRIETGQWNCFNPACGRKGPTIQALYAALTGVPEEEAQAVFPSDLGATDDLRARLNGKVDPHDPQIMAPYPQTIAIRNSPEAVAYMKHRGIPEQVWDRLELAYAFDKRLAASLDGKTAMHGKRIIFPIVLPNGRRGFMGRSIHEDPVPKWRPIENTGTFFYDPLRLIGSKAREVVLVEGEFDLAACVRENLPTMGSFGANIGADRIHLLEQFDRIVLFYDGDQAGRDGMKRAVAESRKVLGERLMTIECPWGYDPAKLPIGFGRTIDAHLKKKVSFLDTLKGRIHG